MIVIAQQTKPWAEFFKKSFFTSDFEVSIPERVKIYHYFTIYVVI